MRRIAILLILAFAFIVPWNAVASGPSGSTECHIQDDDCDGAIDEDTGTAADDDDGDGRVDEDPVDSIDNDADGRLDEDVPDDDGDGLVDEDPPGDALDDPGENQVDCNEQTSQNVGGVTYVYAGSNGVETCADESSTIPLDGRIAVTTDDGGYATADGDNNNTAPGNGYARVDGGGFHCGNTTNQSSDADQTSNTSADCG